MRLEQLVTRVCLLVIVLLVSACSRGTPAAAKTSSAAPASAPPGALVPGGAAAQATPTPETLKPVPTELPDVIARVNGDAIDKSEFQKAVRRVETQAGGTVPPAQRDRIYRDVLDQLVGYRLLAQEVAKRKLTIPDAAVDQRVAEMRQQFPTEEAFRQTLERQQATLDELRSNIRLQLSIDKMLEGELGPQISVTPEAIAEFYQKNPDKFQQAERVHASHILIAVPKGADATASAAARQKATEVLKEVKAGKDFAALAKQYSQDPGSAPNGGDLGFFQRGQMVAPFSDAAFGLKPGDTSDIVQTPFGFHIIKVLEKQPPSTVPLDTVRPQIASFLENQQRLEQTRIFVNGLKARGKVEIYI